MLDNILLMTDSYKVTHWKQYPAGTTRVFSFLESRGGEFSETTFFGLSYLLQRYLAGQVVTREKIEQAARFFKAHFGTDTLFNRAGWEYILDVHQGRLPVIIKSVTEGTTVPVGNVLLTIENTDPNVPWLVNYLETLLVQLWYPITVCTQSREMRKLLISAATETGTPLESLDFKLHDFGYRGSGTDTMAALELAAEYYGEEMAGFSIPAAEHSTIISWGRDGEEAAYRNMLEQYPTGLVAVVSDSYNIFGAVENLWGTKLRAEVLKRDGTVVIRPDSGDPHDVIPTLLDLLGESFGYVTNQHGYKVLNSKVRLIQGDGIDIITLESVLDAVLDAGWAVDNIAFGSGGGLLQKVNRDTCKFAMKCSAVEVNGEWRGVMKSPIGDESKNSKAGRLILRDMGDTYYTDVEGRGQNALDMMFGDGVITPAGLPTLAQIRRRAKL